MKMGQNKEWFEEWFNSPYYHILYKHRDEKEAEGFLKNLSRSLHFQPNDKILDLACGQGRHSIYLNKRGYNVLGLDLAEENIRIASASTNETLRFEIHDMRQPFPEKFRFILNLFTSFGYFKHIEDNRKVLDGCKEMLEWDGRLVIDFFNADLILKNLVKEEVKNLAGIDFHIQKEVREGIITKTISFTDMGKSFRFQERVQALTRANFSALLTDCGFELINTFGDYNLNPFVPDRSPRLILIAKSINL